MGVGEVVVVRSGQMTTRWRSTESGVSVSIPLLAQLYPIASQVATRCKKSTPYCCSWMIRMAGLYPTSNLPPWRAITSSDPTFRLVTSYLFAEIPVTDYYFWGAFTISCWYFLTNARWQFWNWLLLDKIHFSTEICLTFLYDSPHITFILPCLWFLQDAVNNSI